MRREYSRRPGDEHRADLIYKIFPRTHRDQPLETTPRPCSANVPANVLSIFRYFDENQRGFLDAAELSQALLYLGFETTIREAAEIIRRYVSRKRIHVYEFAQLVRDLSSRKIQKYSHSSRYSRLTSTGEYQIHPLLHVRLTGIASGFPNDASAASIVLWLDKRRLASSVVPPPEAGAVDVMMSVSLADHYDADWHSELSLETLTWVPGLGERSCGQAVLLLHDICARGNVTLLDPLGIAVSIEHFPGRCDALSLQPAVQRLWRRA